MGVVEHSSGAVESCLSALEESYGTFSVNQTTIPVPASQYERERDNAGCIDLYAKVRNDHSEVLHIVEDDDERLPSTTVERRRTFEAAVSETVQDAAGIDCQITDVEEVTILGLRDAENDERDTVCRLAVLFEAEREGGSPGETIDWRRPAETVDPAYL